MRKLITIILTIAFACEGSVIPRSTSPCHPEERAPLCHSEGAKRPKNLGTDSTLPRFFVIPLRGIPQNDKRRRNTMTNMKKVITIIIVGAFTLSSLPGASCSMSCDEAISGDCGSTSSPPPEPSRATEGSPERSRGATSRGRACLRQARDDSDLLFFILHPSSFVQCPVSSTLRPLAAAVSEQQPFLGLKGFVQVRDLETGQTRIMKRHHFLKQAREGQLDKVEVTERLSESGELKLGKRYGQIYNVAYFPDHKQCLVRYQIEDSAVTRIVLLGDDGKVAEDAFTLAVVKGLDEKSLDSFLQSDRVLPMRVRELIDAGKVGSIEDLLVREGNILRLSAAMVYDFTSQGNFAGKKVAAHFMGEPNPGHFVVSNKSGEEIRIDVDEVVAALSKAAKPPVSQSLRGEDGAYRTDFVSPEMELPSLERQEIRDAMDEATAELGKDKQDLARMVINNILDFRRRDGSLRLKDLAEYLDVAEADISAIIVLLSQTEAYARIAQAYAQEPSTPREIKKPEKPNRLSIKPDLSVLPKDYVYMRDLETDAIEMISRDELFARNAKTKLDNIEVIYDRLGKRGFLYGGTSKRRQSKNICAFTKHPRKWVRYIIRNGEGDASTVILLNKNGDQLKNGKLRYAVDLDTGEIRCHLPMYISKRLLKRLDNVIIHDRLDQSGVTTFSNIKVCAYTKHPGKRVTYKVNNGIVDKTTLILLDKRGNPLKDDTTRYAVDLETGEIRCHLTEAMRKEFLAKLDNVEIRNARLNAGGRISLGIKKGKQALYLCRFYKHAHRRVRFQIHKGKAIRSTVVLLNEDETVYIDGKIAYAVDTESGEVLCHLPEKSFREIFKELGNAIVYDKLDSGGRLFVATSTGGEGTTLCQFKRHANKRVKYQLKDGKADETTVLLLDDKGEPVEDTNYRYAVEPDTGQIRCHLSQMLWKPMRNRLNGLIIYDRLSKKRGGIHMSSKRVATFTEHKGRRVRYKISGGEADRTTFVLLNEDGTVYIDRKIRYAIDLDTGEIVCHIQKGVSGKVLKSLDNVEIRNDTLNSGGALAYGMKDKKVYHVCKFANQPGRRVKFRVYKGEADRTSVMLLDDNDEPLKGRGTRYVLDPETGEIKCHLPDQFMGDWIKDLGEVIVFDQLDGNGTKSIGKNTITFSGYPRGRLRFRMKGGIPDRRTTVLLDDNEQPLTGESIRYAARIGTGEFICHLPDRVYQELLVQLGDFQMHNDHLDNSGILHFHAKKEGKQIQICTFSDRPGARVMYGFTGGEADKFSVVLLDDKGLPVEEDGLRYAVDNETGIVMCHLPKILLPGRLNGIGSVEIMNARLRRSDGSLVFYGKTVYENHKYLGTKVRYKIHNNSLITMVLLSEDNEIISEEILDPELALKALPRGTDIEYVEAPEGGRIINYADFLERLHDDYVDLEAKRTGSDELRIFMKKRLYEMVHPGVYFFFGDELKEDEQLRLKSEIFLLWKDIMRLPDDEVGSRLIQLTQLFAESAGSAVGLSLRGYDQVPAKLRREISAYRQKMIDQGRLHLLQAELPIIKKKDPAKHSVLQAIDAAA